MASKKSVGKKLQEHWKKLYDSTRNRMSRGASKIFRTISWPKGNKWRRNDRNDKKN